MQFELHVGSISLAQVPHQWTSIIWSGHQTFRKSRPPLRALILDHYSPCVAPRICGEIIGPVLIDRPIQKLQVAVPSYRIGIEKIGHREFSDSKFKTTGR